MISKYEEMCKLIVVAYFKITSPDLFVERDEDHNMSD
jgi:hypothetical protein